MQQHSRLLLTPRPSDEQARALAAAEESIRSLANVADAYVAEFLAIASKYLVNTATAPQVPHTSNADLRHLEPVATHRIYWTELDGIVGMLRAEVFQSAGARLNAVLGTRDAISRAASTRLLIELSIWAAYFQYGLTSAWNQLRRELGQLDGVIVLCEDLERYIRGAVAVDFKRIDGSAASLGILQETPEPEDYVEEFDATFRKQLEGVRFLARQRATHGGQSDLPELVERLHKAYKWCCSLTHVTPVLFAASSQPAVVDAECSPVFLNGTAMALRLLDVLFFEPLFETVVFEPLLEERPAPRRAAVVNVQLDFLRAMLRKNDAVVIQLVDGTKSTIYKQ